MNSTESTWISRGSEEIFVTYARNVVFSVIASITCIGNFLVLLFFYQQRRKVFRSAYSYIVLALSATDLLTGIKLFFSRYFSYTVTLQPTHLVALALFCEIVWRSLFLYFLGFLSLYLCLLLAAERWFATVRPVQHRNAATRKRLALGLLVVFCLAFLTTALNYKPYLYLPNNPLGQRCIPGPSPTAVSIVSVIMGIPLISLIVISVLYSHMAYRVRKSRSHNSTQGQRDAEATRRNKVTKLACITTLALFLCWFPSQISFLLVASGAVPNSGVLDISSAAILFLNSALNPFLYGFALKEYRNGYWEAIRRIFPCVACYKHSGLVVPNAALARGAVHVHHDNPAEQAL